MNPYLEKPLKTAKQRTWLACMEQVEALILRHFPSMPPTARATCVRHCCTPNCGRVFSTNEQGVMPAISSILVTKAVRAHARHKFTAYDSLSMFNTYGRAKCMVQPEIKGLLRQWRTLNT